MRRSHLCSEIPVSQQLVNTHPLIHVRLLLSDNMHMVVVDDGIIWKNGDLE